MAKAELSIRHDFTAPQLRVIRHTVAGDTNDTEFDLFLEACRSYKLDPFRKQIHAVVYSKDDPKKRKMSIIVSRDGLRVIAQRCGDYRPASEPAQIIYDETLIGPANPKGIVSATVRLWKQDNRGEWFPVIGEAYWDEFAPIRQEAKDGYDWVDTGDVWPDTGKPKKRKVPRGNEVVASLDSSGNWARMPIVMITKCSESQALRAGWPDQFGGLYVEEEMDRHAVELTAAEELQAYEREQNQLRLGGPGLMFVFDNTGVLDKVPLGQVHDRCMAFLREATPEEAHAFTIRNAQSLREFWAHDKAAALDVKERLEELEKRMQSEAAA